MFVPYSQTKIQARPRSEDPEDIRVASFVTCVEGAFSSFLEKLSPDDFVLLGYADDRGVDRNGGRIGAAEAPDEIRRFLYAMTPPPESSNVPRIWDLGNLRSWSVHLLEAHESARGVLKQLRVKGVRVLSLGGGHDWAYADFVDLDKAHLINLDAHLDVRPIPTSQDKAGHSGTPFRRILTNEKKSPDMIVSFVGLQRHCNAASHLRWAQGQRVHTVFLEDLPNLPREQMDFLVEKLEIKVGSRPYALSIDMDAFAQAVSPGVSAPQALGIDPRLAQALIQNMGRQLRQLGIYEVNPKFDRDGASARLAAKLAHEFLFTDHS